MTTSISINIPIIYLSLKYVNKNYRSICGISKWFNFELTKSTINKKKFIRSLSKKDFEVTDRLIKFDKTIRSKFFVKEYSTVYSIINDGRYFMRKLNTTINGFDYCLVYVNYNNHKMEAVSYLNIENWK